MTMIVSDYLIVNLLDHALVWGESLIYGRMGALAKKGKVIKVLNQALQHYVKKLTGILVIQFAKLNLAQVLEL